MPKVLVEMEAEHAEAVARILDLGVRIHLGQIEEITSLARLGELKRRDEASSNGRTLNSQECDRLDSSLAQVKWIMGHPQNGSFGIGAPGVSTDAKRAYEVTKAVRKALHDAGPNPQRISVHGDGVLVRYADGDVPTARVV